MFHSIILGKEAGDFLHRIQCNRLPFGIEQIRTAIEEMCERSAVTPGVLTTSYRASSSTSGQALSRRDNGYLRLTECVFQDVLLSVPDQCHQMLLQQLIDK